MLVVSFPNSTAIKAAKAHRSARDFPESLIICQSDKWSNWSPQRDFQTGRVSWIILVGVELFQDPHGALQTVVVAFVNIFLFSGMSNVNSISSKPMLTNKVTKLYNCSRVPPFHASWDIHRSHRCHPCTWGNRGNQDGLLQAQHCPHETIWRALPWLGKKNGQDFNIKGGHQWEAHALTTELQGCQADKGPLTPMAIGQEGASQQHSQHGLSGLRTIWEDTGVSCCSSPTSSIVKQQTDIWLQQCRCKRIFFCVVEFIFHSYCPFRFVPLYAERILKSLQWKSLGTFDICPLSQYPFSCEYSGISPAADNLRSQAGESDQSLGGSTGPYCWSHISLDTLKYCQICVADLIFYSADWNENNSAICEVCFPRIKVAVSAMEYTL